MMLRVLSLIAVLFASIGESGVRCSNPNGNCSSKLGWMLYGCCCGSHCWVVTIFHLSNCGGYCRGRRSVIDVPEARMLDMPERMEEMDEGHMATSAEAASADMDEEALSRMDAIVAAHNEAYVAAQSNWLIGGSVVLVLAGLGMVVRRKWKASTAGTEYEAINPVVSAA